MPAKTHPTLLHCYRLIAFFLKKNEGIFTANRRAAEFIIINRF